MHVLCLKTHLEESIYINKPIQDYDEMSIVYGNDQANGSFVKTGSQSSRRLDASMKQQPTSLVIDLDNQTQTQGFNDFDEVVSSQPPINGTPTGSTSKAKEGKE